MTTERIPIWLHDKKLWISDADRRTTCADVVATLTGRGGDYAVAVDGGGRSAAGAATVHADPGVRLLKVWQSLRPDQKLCLRKINGGAYDVPDGDDGDCDDPHDDAASEMSGYRAHRKRRRDVVKYASRTVHPKRLSDTQAAEQLLRLILEQSDTIRAQLKKLRDRDKKIEKIETDTHKTRADALGSNYLLDAYLVGDDEKEEKDSGITEGASVENDDGGGGGGGSGGVGGGRDETDDAGGSMSSSASAPPSLEASALEAIAYLERIVRINKKLYEHEERMIRLYVNVERCRDRDQLLDELKRAEERLADAERMCRENGAMIRTTDVEMRARLGYAEQLQYEAAIVDSENEYLADFVEHQVRHLHQQQQERPPHDVRQHHKTAGPVADTNHRVLDTLV